MVWCGVMGGVGWGGGGVGAHACRGEDGATHVGQLHQAVLWGAGWGVQMALGFDAWGRPACHWRPAGQPAPARPSGHQHSPHIPGRAHDRRQHAPPPPRSAAGCCRTQTCMGGSVGGGGWGGGGGGWRCSKGYGVGFSSKGEKCSRLLWQVHAGTSAINTTRVQHLYHPMYSRPPPTHARAHRRTHLRSTAHVVSRRPRSMKRACRNRKPGRLSPLFMMPCQRVREAWLRNRAR